MHSSVNGAKMNLKSGGKFTPLFVRTLGARINRAKSWNAKVGVYNSL